MLTFGTPDPRVLDVVGTVVERLEQDTGVLPSAVMVVGAHARNIIHSGLKHSTSPRATDDVDLALALSGWDAYLPVTTTFPRSGDSDIRYRVGDIHVDFMPFGPALEDPPGVVTPRRVRRDGRLPASRMSTAVPKTSDSCRKETPSGCPLPRVIRR